MNLGQAAKKTTGNLATVVPFMAQLMLIDGNILFLSLLQLAFKQSGDSRTIYDTRA